MTYWLKKRDHVDQKQLKDKTEIPEDKKDGRSKRLDNLRVHRALQVQLSSIGHQTILDFQTKDLSASGLFISNENFDSLPFMVNSTLICGVIFLGKHPKTQKEEKIEFIAKIARVVYPEKSFPKIKPGLGLRIVQISDAERRILNSYVAAHGEPEYDPKSIKQAA